MTFNDHFYLVKSMRSGAILICVLVVLIHVGNYYLQRYARNNSEMRNREMEELSEIDSVTVVSNASIPLSNFDPNLADSLTLVNHGLSSFAIRNLIKLRSTGWRAYDADDLQKVYGIESKDIERMQNYIVIPRAEIKKESSGHASQYNGPNRKNDRRSTSETLASETHKKIESGPTLHSFDPNSTTAEELKGLGFSNLAAKSLVEYIDAGGRMYKKEDLKKIYGIEEEFYLKIEPFITIEQTGSKEIIETTLEKSTDQSIENKDTATTVVSPITIYNLNDVSQEELLSVNGIGRYYSKAIIEYREKLGGYVSVDQLLEIPAFREESFDRVKGSFQVSGKVKRLLPPQLEFKQVLQHPYVDYETAKKLKNISVRNYEEELHRLIEERAFEDRLIPYLRK